MNCGRCGGDACPVVTTRAMHRSTQKIMEWMPGKKVAWVPNEE
jgi:hypothetical protein